MLLFRLVLRIVSFTLLWALFSNIWALTDAEQKRLEALRSFSLEDLQEIEIKLDDVFDVFSGLVKTQNVKVASGIQQSTATAPASTTVITAQDIEAMGAGDVAEILAAVPGIHISLNEVRFQPMYDVRGMHSAVNYEMLVMVNGVPIKSITDGARIGHTPPIQNIQRIEVIRGPGSALYGADAVAGVVNIITKTRRDIADTELGFRLGSHQTYNPWLLYGSSLGNGFELALSLDYFNTDGHQETVHQDAQSLLDLATDTQVSEAPGRAYLQQRRVDWRADVRKDHWRLNLNWQRLWDAGEGLGPSLVISPEADYSKDFYQVDLSYHNSEWHRHWAVSALLSYQDVTADRYHTYSTRPGAIRNDQAYPYGAPNDFSFAQRHTRFNLSGSYRGWSAHTLRLGAGYWYADLHSVPWSYLLDPTDPVMVDVRALGMALIPEKIRKNWHMFVQDSWAFARSWALTLGVRHDWYSDFDSTTNPRAALVWQITPRLTTKWLYGTAFRAPSFLEMYTPRNRALVGNPDLKAERNTTWEWVWDYHANDNLNLALNLFYYKVKDKVLRRLLEQADRTIYMYDNIGTLKGRGLEVEARWKINHKSSLLANYAYTQVDTESGDEAGNYPHHQVYLRHDWLLGRSWFLDTRLNWIASRERPVMDVRAALDDYVEFDVTLRYKDVSNDGPWNIALGVRNALDEDRREPGDPRIVGDYPKAGRTFFTEIRYRFK